ncbi:hypothetical protein CKO51_20395 [Rhodopirellula sp. SM50]|nr:hypothetical protein CKO51_20395 [Rhodopirellula sp. SM50]
MKVDQNTEIGPEYRNRVKQGGWPLLFLLLFLNKLGQYIWLYLGDIGLHSVDLPQGRSRHDPRLEDFLARRNCVTDGLPT